MSSMRLVLRINVVALNVRGICGFIKWQCSFHVHYLQLAGHSVPANLM